MSGPKQTNRFRFLFPAQAGKAKKVLVHISAIMDLKLLTLKAITSSMKHLGTTAYFKKHKVSKKQLFKMKWCRVCKMKVYSIKEHNKAHGIT